MNSKEIGPFAVRELTVGEGLPLLKIMTEDTNKFQNELVLACTTKDGKPVKELPFSELIPHMGDIIVEAMRINGFLDKE